MCFANSRIAPIGQFESLLTFGGEFCAIMSWQPTAYAALSPHSKLLGRFCPVGLNSAGLGVCVFNLHDRLGARTGVRKVSGSLLGGRRLVLSSRLSVCRPGAWRLLILFDACCVVPATIAQDRGLGAAAMRALVELRSRLATKPETASNVPDPQRP